MYVSGPLQENAISIFSKNPLIPEKSAYEAQFNMLM